MASCSPQFPVQPVVLPSFQYRSQDHQSSSTLNLHYIAPIPNKGSTTSLEGLSARFESVGTLAHQGDSCKWLSRDKVATKTFLQRCCSYGRRSSHLGQHYCLYKQPKHFPQFRPNFSTKEGKELVDCCFSVSRVQICNHLLATWERGLEQGRLQLYQFSGAKNESKN